MYYIHLHGNYGYLYLILPGNTDWSCWNIEYAQDVRFEILDSKAKEINVNDLPEALTCTFDFGRIREDIREVFQLNKPAELEKEIVK
jgi:hypothetical protein